MATTTQRKSNVKYNGLEASEMVQDRLEDLARAGAREMLMRALSEEVDSYLGRGRYERTGEYRGYRNGSTARKQVSWRSPTAARSSL